MLPTRRPAFQLIFFAASLLLFVACATDSGPKTDCEEGEQRETESVCGLNDEGVLVEACTDAGLFELTETCTGTDVCVNEEAQEGATTCGLNEEGVFMQDCTEGAWVDNETCTGTDVCVNGERQDTETICGLNEEGILTQDCVEGAWVDGTCTGDDACLNGETQDGTTACGLNDEGVLGQDCTDGQWADNETCTGTDVCVNGETQDTETVCGLNEEGVITQDCTEGAWVDGACTGADVCVNEDAQEGTTACGLNNEGVLGQDCTDGQWVDNETCTGTDVCVNGEGQDGSTVCGLNEEGVYTQDCTGGQWVDNETCTGTDVCVNGETQDGTTVCGYNDDGFVLEECVAGVWADKEDDAGCNDDTTWVDSYGDGCLWYIDYPTDCDIADQWVNSDGVDAQDACCICDGGINETSNACSAETDCINGDSQKGDSPCGLNGEGGLMQDCVQGVWVDNETCEDANDVCVNGTKEDTGIACGMNLEGFGQNLCVSGQWIPYLSGMDACVDDATFFDINLQGCWTYNWGCETALDNVNANGVDATMACCACGGGTSVCTGTDECYNGDTREDVEGDTCGLNNEGYFQQECIDGLWENTTTCSGTHECINGTSQPSPDATCTTGEAQRQDCIYGSWQDQNLTIAETCTDDATFVDSEGGTCEAYTNDSALCDEAEDFTNADGLEASETCCECGGGSTTGGGIGPACFEPLLLKGVMDFDLPGSSGKAIHLVIHEDIPDLSIYSIGVANNGGGTDGAEFQLPAMSVGTNQQILVARDEAALETYFGSCFAVFDIVITADFNISQNGDDAIELFEASPGTCADDEVWVDSYGDACNSSWYADPGSCATASMYTNLDGVDASMACCICGGGTTVVNQTVIQTYGDPSFQPPAGHYANYADAWAYRYWGNNWNDATANCTDGASDIFDSTCLYPACEPFVEDE